MKRLRQSTANRTQQKDPTASPGASMTPAREEHSHRAADPASGDRALTLALIASEPAARRRLITVFEAQNGIRFAGAFASVEAAESELTRLKVQVAVIGEDGAVFPREHLRKLKFLAPSLSLVMHSRRSDGPSIFSCLTAGAAAYVLQTAPLDQLTQAIAEAAQGRVFLCRQAEFEALEHLRLIARQPGRQTLTPRQAQVCIWLCSCPEKGVARGLESMSRDARRAQAASRLIAAETVHTHAEAIFKKLGVHGRQELHDLLGGAFPGSI